MMLRITCVISFYYGNSYTHCRKSSVPSFLGCEETRRFYTETLLHTEAFTHRRFYTQQLLYTETFTHRRFYTQTLLHTDSFTHRRFYTPTLLHTDHFTHRHFFLNTEAFTHRRFLNTDAFIHRHFYTQTILHTDTFTRPVNFPQSPDFQKMHAGPYPQKKDVDSIALNAYLYPLEASTNRFASTSS